MAEVLPAARITSLIWLGMVVVACGLAYSSCTTYVAPNEVGILESRLVAPTGIREKMYPGGRLYFLLLGQTMHHFPTDLQVLELTSHPRRVERAERPRRGAGRDQHLGRLEGRPRRDGALPHRGSVRGDAAGGRGSALRDDGGDPEDDRRAQEEPRRDGRRGFLQREGAGAARREGAGAGSHGAQGQGHRHRSRADAAVLLQPRLPAADRREEGPGSVEVHPRLRGRGRRRSSRRSRRSRRRDARRSRSRPSAATPKSPRSRPRPTLIVGSASPRRISWCSSPTPRAPSSRTAPTRAVGRRTSSGMKMAEVLEGDGHGAGAVGRQGRA